METIKELYDIIKNDDYKSYDGNWIRKQIEQIYNHSKNQVKVTIILQSFYNSNGNHNFIS